MIFTKLYCVLEREISVKGVENWLEENDSDPGYQVLSTEEIVESVLAVDQPGESSSSDSEDEVVVRQKMSQVRYCSDTLIQYVDDMLMTVTFKVFMNTSAH